MTISQIIICVTSGAIALFSVLVAFRVKSKTKDNHIIQSLGLYLVFIFYGQAILSIFNGYSVFKYSYEYLFFCTCLLYVLFRFLGLGIRYIEGKVLLILISVTSIGTTFTLIKHRYTVLTHRDYLQELVWLLHMSSNVTGVVFLSVSVFLGVNYMRNQAMIKNHKDLAQLDQFKLPLSKIDEMMAKLLMIVFSVINISLLTGIVLAHSLWSSAWISSAKFIVSIGMWAIFALMVWGRLKKGWRGKVFVQGLLICDIILIGLVLLSFSQ